jgi:hypothetical protein
MTRAQRHEGRLRAETPRIPDSLFAFLCLRWEVTRSLRAQKGAIDENE